MAVLSQDSWNNPGRWLLVIIVGVAGIAGGVAVGCVSDPNACALAVTVWVCVGTVVFGTAMTILQFFTKTFATHAMSLPEDQVDSVFRSSTMEWGISVKHCLYLYWGLGGYASIMACFFTPSKELLRATCMGFAVALYGNLPHLWAASIAGDVPPMDTKFYVPAFLSMFMAGLSWT